MKTVFVALLTLAVALRSAKSQDMMEEDESVVDIVRDIMRTGKAFIEGDNDVRPPSRKKIAKVIASIIPPLDPVPMLSKVYGCMCGVKNCKKNAPICLRSVFPEGAFELIRGCIPDAAEAKSMDMDPKVALQECIMKSAMKTLGLEGSDQGSYDANAKMIMTEMINRNTNITDEARTRMEDAVMTGLCPIPPQGSCMSDMMKFKGCLVDTCVMAMYNYEMVEEEF